MWVRVILKKSIKTRFKRQQSHVSILPRFLMFGFIVTIIRLKCRFSENSVILSQELGTNSCVHLTIKAVKSGEFMITCMPMILWLLVTQRTHTSKQIKARVAGREAITELTQMDSAQVPSNRRKQRTVCDVNKTRKLLLSRRELNQTWQKPEANKLTCERLMNSVPWWALISREIYRLGSKSGARGMFSDCCVIKSLLRQVVIPDMFCKRNSRFNEPFRHQKCDLTAKAGPRKVLVGHELWTFQFRLSESWLAVSTS